MTNVGSLKNHITSKALTDAVEAVRRAREELDRVEELLGDAHAIIIGGAYEVYPPDAA